MNTLAQTLLALMLTHATPPGRSVYSFETLPECGTDPAWASCPLVPVCRQQGPLCEPPRWSKPRGAWVRVESRDAAVRRWSGIAQSLARTATFLVTCRNERGSVVEECQPVDWRGKSGSLARAAATMAIYESGLREDVMNGLPPVGRGQDGEVCLLQIQPEQVAKFGYAVDDVLGERGLDKCFALGMRMLSQARRSCARTGLDWPFAMYSRIGTGRTCNATGIMDDFALKRSKLYWTMDKTKKAKLDPEISALLGLSTE